MVFAQQGLKDSRLCVHLGFFEISSVSSGMNAVSLEINSAHVIIQGFRALEFKPRFDGFRTLAVRIYCLELRV